MQALKKFNSGEEDTKGSSGSSMQKFLSIAMAEASKVREILPPHYRPQSPSLSPLASPLRSNKNWIYTRSGYNKLTPPQLFDDKASSGKVASGTKKDDVVKQAGEMALKLFLKSQGGSQGGGASGLMGMASKFL